ncbi:hypothetical protein ACJIZ3_013850 [Penstemon smallii]|uniref:Protein XRI1 n=1 Tax=Penstemon smallii TaxID=265156 RepID=A0ABD3RHV9_9LAMI
MNYNNENEMWDWQGQNNYLEDSTNIEISKCLLNGVSQNEDLSYMFDDGTTPIKACGDLTHPAPNNVKGKELELYNEPSSQVKRRRTLQFDSELLSAPLCNDEAFLRSKETVDSLEDVIADMSEWVAGFAEDVPGSSNECLDPSSEGWIADCFNDTEMHFSNEDINVPGESDVQIDITELCNTHPEYDATAVQNHSVQTNRNVVFKGRKSYMRSPPKLASSVVYPFAFIKPCGAHGDVTLNDINERIHNPPKSKQKEDPTVPYPTSAFSGKPVVGKTKIHTEGGKGSITIMRTKG